MTNSFAVDTTPNDTSRIALSDGIGLIFYEVKLMSKTKEQQLKDLQRLAILANLNLLDNYMQTEEYKNGYEQMLNKLMAERSDQFPDIRSCGIDACTIDDACKIDKFCAADLCAVENNCDLLFCKVDGM